MPLSHCGIKLHNQKLIELLPAPVGPITLMKCMMLSEMKCNFRRSYAITISFSSMEPWSALEVTPRSFVPTRERLAYRTQLTPRSSLLEEVSLISNPKTCGGGSGGNSRAAPAEIHLCAMLRSGSYALHQRSHRCAGLG